MRHVVIAIFSLVIITSVFGCKNSTISSSQTDLYKVIKQQEHYDRGKNHRIDSLRKALEQGTNNPSLKFDICLKLYDEFKAFKYDSAYTYAVKLHEISVSLGDSVKENYSRTKLGFILLCSGKYREAFTILEHIDHRGFNEFAMEDYYSIMIRAYTDLAKYDNDKAYSPVYKKKANLYLDSAIRLSSANSYSRLFLTAYGNFVNENYASAINQFLKLKQIYKPAPHEAAIIASLLGNIYLRMGNTQNAKEYLITAVSEDIRSSTKETLAIFNLAELSSKEGNVDDAYLYIKQALGDAEFYGARQREIQISALLPIIAAQKLTFLEEQRNRFLIYLFSTLFLVAVIIIISFLLYRQLMNSKHKEQVIIDTNNKLEQINAQLITANHLLTHANLRFAEDSHIKEIYMGDFFKIISIYILKLEKLKTSIEAKLIQQKPHHIQSLIDDVDINKEREELYHTFDRMFLKIFPNFIVSFNKMFNKDEQIWPKEYEILTTDLRIFALIRLGIHDNEVIAKILQYTAKTVYVYKMRTKAKSLLNSNEFDTHLMNIKSVESAPV